MIVCNAMLCLFLNSEESLVNLTRLIARITHMCADPRTHLLHLLLPQMNGKALVAMGQSLVYSVPCSEAAMIGDKRRCMRFKASQQ
jgi:hypothetical protein